MSVEKLRSVLVTDRTAADVAARNEKGTYNAEDLNRVLRACSWLAGQMEARGYSVDGEFFPAVLVRAESDPPEGGEVRGALGYRGEMVSVYAAPGYGFEFNAWKEGGKVVSDKPKYTFIADHDIDIVAEFVASGGSALGVVGIGNIGYAQIGVGTKGE